MRTSELRTGIRILAAISFATIASGLIASPTAANETDTTGQTDQASAASGSPSDSSNSVRPAVAKPSYKPYFVEFRSRSAASYGHMYVFYGQLNGNGEITKSDIAGFHPKGDANDCENCSLIPWTVGHVLFVPSEIGASDGDLEEKYVTGRYRVMVDGATYNKLSAHIKRVKAEKPLWNALVNNCVTFGNDIAGLIGLKTPSGANLLKPEDFIDSLRELNGGKPQRALRFAAPTSSKPAAGPSPAPTKPKKEPVANLAPTSSPSPAVEVSGATR
jgi:hypothetical protein